MAAAGLVLAAPGVLGATKYFDLAANTYRQPESKLTLDFIRQIKEWAKNGGSPGRYIPVPVSYINGEAYYVFTIHPEYVPDLRAMGYLPAQYTHVLHDKIAIGETERPPALW
jgi:hypothetical protein